MAQAVFEVVSKDPEEEHVAGDVCDAAVHEHRNNQGQVNREWRRLKTGNQKLLTGDRMFHYLDRVW